MSFAPKEDEVNYIEVDGVNVATFDKKNCLFGFCSEYNVKDMEGNLVITYLIQNIKDPKYANRNNADGSKSYVEWTFYKSEIKVETESTIGGKKFAKYLVEQGIFTKDGYNEQGVKNFKLKYGTKFTDQANRKTIIEIK